MIPRTQSVRVYGLVLREGEILMANSLFFKKTEFVNFPGGGVEVGEAPRAALEREFLEETGLAVEPVRILYASEALHASTQLPLQIVALYWLVRPVGGTLVLDGNGDDVLGLFWRPHDRLPLERMFPAEREFCERLPGMLSREELAGFDFFRR